LKKHKEDFFVNEHDYDFREEIQNIFNGFGIFDIRVIHEKLSSTNYW